MGGGRCKFEAMKQGPKWGVIHYKTWTVVVLSQNSFDHLTNCALVSQKTFISSTPSPFLVSAGSTLKKAKMTKPADSIYTFFDIERQDSNSCAGGEFLIDVIDSSKSYLN